MCIYMCLCGGWWLYFIYGYLGLRMDLFGVGWGFIYWLYVFFVGGISCVFSYVGFACVSLWWWIHCGEVGDGGVLLFVILGRLVYRVVFVFMFSCFLVIGDGVVVDDASLVLVDVHPGCICELVVCLVLIVYCVN